LSFRAERSAVEESNSSNNIAEIDPSTPLRSVGMTSGRGEVVYRELQHAGIEVFFDDRDVSPGEKFADADLIGVPVRLVVSAKTGDKIEWKERSSKAAELLTIEEVIRRLKI